MTENSTSDVGRAVIDAYLDSVEQVLLAADAPRSDRAQVLQDLESQIADMLAREPAPLTGEIVQSVIQKLEPASHFAAMYGNGKQPPAARPNPTQVRGVAAIRWSAVAAVCFALPIVGILLEVLFNLSARGDLRERHSGAFLVLSIVAALVATPSSLAMAYKQLRALPDRIPDRVLVTKMIIAYAIIAPAFVMIVLAEWTYGLVLIPFGFVAVVYLLFEFVKRLRRFLAETLPPQPANVPAGNGSQREAAPPLGSTMSPAM